MSMTNLLSTTWVGPEGGQQDKDKDRVPEARFRFSRRSGTLPRENQLRCSVLETLLSVNVRQCERIEQPSAK